MKSLQFPETFVKLISVLEDCLNITIRNVLTLQIKVQNYCDIEKNSKKLRPTLNALDSNSTSQKPPKRRLTIWSIDFTV